MKFCIFKTRYNSKNTTKSYHNIKKELPQRNCEQYWMSDLPGTKILHLQKQSMGTREIAKYVFLKICHQKH